MYLKKLRKNCFITIVYFTNGDLQTIKGYIDRLNPVEQILFLKDDKQSSFTIRLSDIRDIY